MHGVNIYEIRRANLERMLREKGSSLVDFSRRTSVSAIYLTQVLSDKTQRHMGDKVARRIEAKLELPNGWLDMVNAPMADLSELAIAVAAKFDQLPEKLQEKIAAEIDTLHRYHADK